MNMLEPNSKYLIFAFAKPSHNSSTIARLADCLTSLMNNEYEDNNKSKRSKTIRKNNTKPRSVILSLKLICYNFLSFLPVIIVAFFDLALTIQLHNKTPLVRQNSERLLYNRVMIFISENA